MRTLDDLAILIDSLTAEFRTLKESIERSNRRKPRQEPTGTLLTLSEAARRLGIDRHRTLHNMIRDKRIKAVMVNGRYKIPLAEIERIEQEGLPRAGRHAPKNNGQT